MRRRGEQTGGSIDLDHFAQIEKRNLVRATRGLLHVMGNNGDGKISLQLLNQLFDFPRC